jgi:hypothetical protein
MPFVQTAANAEFAFDKQTAEGTISTTPDYRGPVFENLPVPVQSSERVEVTDNAAIVGDPYKTDVHWEADVTMPGFANGLGTFMAGLGCTDSNTTPANRALSAGTVSGTIATVTTATHSFLVGDLITISGATPSGYNGTFVVRSVPSATTFTIDLGVTGVGSWSSGGNAILAGTRVHRFSALGNATVWTTMYATKPGGLIETFEDGQISGIAVSADSPGAPIRVNVKAMGKRPTVASYSGGTAMALSDGYFIAAGGQFAYEVDAATPVVGTNVQSTTITLDRGVTTVPNLNSIFPNNLSYSKFDVSFNTTLIWNDDEAYRATYYGGVAGSTPGAAFVKGSLAFTFRHTVSDYWLKLTIPSAVFAVDAPQPDASGGPYLVTVNGFATKPASGDILEVSLGNGVATAY